MKRNRLIDRGGARSPLVELSLARFREFLREPEAIFWTFVFPILIAVALAVAFPGRQSPVVVGIREGEQGGAVRDVLRNEPGVTVRDVSEREEGRALREGQIHVLVIPTEPPTYRYDPTRAESRLARLVVDDALKRADGRTDPWQAEERPVQVAGSRYVDWLIPGIVGMNIMGSSIWGLGFSIVSARMRHLLKRLVASPMRKRDYLLAQLMARLAFLAPEVIVPLAFGALVLGMPIAGGWGAIALISLAGSLAFGAIGLLVSTRARSVEAISGMANLVMLPMWILSGVFFSSANFPEAAQPLVQALPLTALIDALRAVILDGASLRAVSNELALLAAWTLIPFALALRLFRWR